VPFDERNEAKMDSSVKSKKLNVKSEKTVISETFRGEKLKVKSKEWKNG
jgi:hypothetical protein